MKKDKDRIVRVSRFLNFLIVNGFSNLEIYNADVRFILYLNHNYCSCEQRGITKQNKKRKRDNLIPLKWMNRATIFRYNFLKEDLLMD